MMATKLLRQQHRSLEQLLVRVAEERDARLSLVLQLVEELLTHLSVEDHFFLAAIADKTRIRIEAYREQQARVRNAVLQAVFVEHDDQAFDARLRELTAELDRHTHVMERDLFPLVEGQLHGAELEAIGARMDSYWHEALGTQREGAPTHVHAAE
jgi:hypothetical protein